MKRKGIVKWLLGDETEEPDPTHLSLEKADMIRGVVSLSEKTVKEIMVPRVDMVCVSIDDDPNELCAKAGESGHSRLPVYKESIDNVVGILYAKDLLSCDKLGESFELANVVRKPYFVPESARLDALMREMRRRKMHIAMVVDEYGGISGIVCLEDIIEEIVGEIQDEFDNEREDIVALGERIFLCDARAEISQLNEELHLNLPNRDFDTLGGFVFELFGKVPGRYEQATHKNMKFIIQDMNGNRIESVKIIIEEIAPEKK